MPQMICVVPTIKQPVMIMLLDCFCVITPCSGNYRSSRYDLVLEGNGIVDSFVGNEGAKCLTAVACTHHSRLLHCARRLRMSGSSSNPRHPVDHVARRSPPRPISNQEPTYYQQANMLSLHTLRLYVEQCQHPAAVSTCEKRCLPQLWCLQWCRAPHAPWPRAGACTPPSSGVPTGTRALPQALRPRCGFPMALCSLTK